MFPRIPGLLEVLYGASRSESLSAQVARLLQEWRARGLGASPPLPQCPPASSPVPHRRLAVDQRDALLITYADQVHDSPRPPLRVLAEFAERHLRGLVSGIHLLPFYPWSSDDGFAVKDYRAVDPAFGSWEDIARLGATFDLMFDAVFNHLSAQGDWFQRFLAAESPYDTFFVTVDGDPDLSAVVRPRALPLLTEFRTARGPRRVWTTFSADQVDLDVRNPAVLLALLDILLFYVHRGARFIRLDAIAFLWKEPGTTCLHRPETHVVIQLMRAVLDEIAPGVLLVTETNVPHQDNLSYFGDGSNEAQMVYNFALPPLVLHAFQTASAARLTGWAASLSLPSDGVTFFNFLASHDGVGLNPARGILADAEIDALVERTRERGGAISYKNMPDGSQLPYELNVNYLDALTDPGDRAAAPDGAAHRLLTAHALMLSLQGVPGLYFHSLFGSRGDRAAMEASGINRRINRAKLDLSGLEAELGRPSSLRSLVFRGCANLLRARRNHAGFSPGSPQEVLELDSRLFAVLRGEVGSDRVLCLHNVSADTVPVGLPPLLQSEAVVPFVGPIQGPIRPGAVIDVPPFATVWLDLRRAPVSDDAAATRPG